MMSLNNKKGVTMIPKKISKDKWILEDQRLTNRIVVNKINDLISYLQERDGDRVSEVYTNGFRDGSEARREREVEKCRRCPYCIGKCLHTKNYYDFPPQQTDEWESKYAEIMLEWIESQWKIEAAQQSGEPYTRMKMEAEASKVDNKLKSFIRTHFIEKKKVREVLSTAQGGEVYKRYGIVDFKDLLSSLQLTEDESVI